MSGGGQFGSQYLLGEQLGSGAMGRVFAGTMRDTGEQVAIKILREDLSSNADVVARFVQERQVLKAIRHPNVVGVRDLVVEGDRLGIIMDLVPGGDMRRAVRLPVNAGEALTMTAQIAAGLEAVHEAGVVHRDLKPENVLVDRSGGLPHLRITDFGVSRLVGQTLTRVTSLIGTPGYLAPEVAGGERPTPAADVYALGALLFEMVTGRGPFEAENVLALMRAHADDPVPRPEGMPDALWSMVYSMLAKRPEDRPTATEVVRQAQELHPAVTHLGPFPVVAGVVAQGAAHAATTIARAAPGGVQSATATGITVPLVPRPPTKKRRRAGVVIGIGLALACIATAPIILSLSDGGGDSTGAVATTTSSAETTAGPSIKTESTMAANDTSPTDASTAVKPVGGGTVTTAAPTAPAAPSVHGSVNGNSISWNWSLSSPGNRDFLRFDVYLLKSSLCPPSCWPNAVQSGGGTSYTAGGLEYGTEYLLRVVAYNTAQLSSSTELKLTTDAYVPPSAPNIAWSVTGCWGSGKPKVTFTWSVVFGSSPLKQYSTVLEGSGWYVGTGTSSTHNGEWNTTYTLQVTVETLDGATNQATLHILTNSGPCP